jgi:hypothetical protein
MNAKYGGVKPFMNNSQCATDKPLSNKEEVEHNLAVKWS